MSKILELREKRAKVWEQAKAFLDNKRDSSGIISAEDTATYEKMEADVVALGKEIDRLERQQALDIELSRPTSKPLTGKPEGGETKEGRASAEYQQAFWKAMRNKNSFDIQNALRIGEQSEGGYLVPDEFEKKLIQALQDENIIRSLAYTIKTSSGERKIPVVTSEGEAAWIDENEEIPESDDGFGVVQLGAHKLARIIKVSEELLNDSVFDLESHIAKSFARSFGRAEEKAFLTGNSTGRPTGILTSGDSVTTTGTTITSDEIIDFYHSLREPYRKNAVFITNDLTVKTIRKLKDANGQYIWQPSTAVNAPDTILGKPYKTSIYVPTVAAGAKVLAFGDISYYWIADRQGRTFQRLNELYAAKGQVGFRATQRVDGKLTLPEAVKVLKIKE